MRDEHALGRTAASQHGVLTSSQMRLHGFDVGTLKYRRRSGRLQQRARGVDVVAGARASWEQEAVIAQLAVGQLSAVSRRSATRVWRIGTFDAPIEIAAPYARSPAVPGAIVHRSLDLAPEHVTLVDGIVVTTAARTLIDVGAVLPQFLVERLYERAVGRGLTSDAELRQMVHVLGRKGRRGAGVLRRVLDGRPCVAAMRDSELEEIFLRVCRDFTLPIPAAQLWLDLRAGRARLDFAYPEEKIAIEVDGFEAHSSLDAFEVDRARQNELIRLGWRVLRFTRTQLVRDPAGVASTIRSLLTSPRP